MGVISRGKYVKPATNTALVQSQYTRDNR